MDNYFNFVGANWMDFALKHPGISIPDLQESLWQSWFKLSATAPSTTTKKKTKPKTKKPKPAKQQPCFSGLTNPHMEKLLSNCKNGAGEGNASKVEGFVRREGVTSDQTLEGGKVEDSGRGMKGVNKTSHKVVLINKEDFVNSFAQLGHIGMEGDVGISAAMEGQEVVSVVVNSTFMEENESDSTQIKGRNEENRATVNTEGENINDMEGTENSDTVKGKGENSDTVVVTGEDVEGENSDATKEGEVNRRRQTQPARRKSCMPKFVPPRKIVCGVPFCLFCKAKSCKSCKMCLMKKKCMLRQCPNLSNKKDNFADFFPNCATLMVNSSSQDTSIIQDDSVLENDKAIAIIMTEDIGRDYGSEYGSGTSSHSLSASQIVSTSILSMVEHGSANSKVTISLNSRQFSRNESANIYVSNLKIIRQF